VIEGSFFYTKNGERKILRSQRAMQDICLAWYRILLVVVLRPRLFLRIIGAERTPSRAIAFFTLPVPSWQTPLSQPRTKEDDEEDLERRTLGFMTKPHAVVDPRSPRYVSSVTA
jgi:hypothetical protein